MRKHRRLTVPIIAAAAAAIALAPPAGASANPINCNDRGTAKVCNKQGHAALHAEPTVRMPQGQLFSNAWLPGYGRGHLPPLLALD